MRLKKPSYSKRFQPRLPALQAGCRWFETDTGHKLKHIDLNIIQNIVSIALATIMIKIALMHSM